jgi:hypothetical protein
LKKPLFSLLLLLLCLGLSGCIEVDYYIKVNRDASADIEYKICFDQIFIGLMETQGEDPLSQVRLSAEEKGFTVSHYSENDITGIIAKKHADTLQELPGINSIWAEADIQTATIDGAGSPFKVEPGFFFNRYLVDTTVDLSEMKEQAGEDDFGLSSAFLKKIKMRFRITLPVKPKSHNAPYVTDEGYTLGWDLLPGQVNRIMLEAAVPNLRTFALLAAAALLTAALIAWLTVKKKKQAAGL